ncbi:hypothetical protein HUJ05_001148 [Dendroctonus ponderosae]|nr:hypothetical protein HUJ05_001148 [Dendroctonus ponderosae]
MAAEMGSEIKNDHVKAFESLSIISHNCSSGPSLRGTQKLKITECMNELEKIVYLVDAHVPKLRERTAFSYHLQAEQEECKEAADEFRQFKKLIFPPCNQTLEDGFNLIMQQIAELPKEWTIVQLTSQYSPEEHINFNRKRYYSTGLHISVFNCGTDKAVPFVVTVPPPTVNGVKLELMQAHMDGLANYQSELNSRVNQKAFRNYRDRLIYVQKYEEIEMCLKETIQNITCHWLREWRCLLSGKFEEKRIDNFIRDELEEIIKNVLPEQTVSNRAKDLLYYVAKGALHLSDKEIISSMAQIFGEEAPLKVLVRLIKKLNVELFSQFTNFAKHPLILVIDENLDNLHWEMMHVLREESVTRVPSLHFAYILFKMHEKDMENGYKIISNYKNGQYIVNPESNLQKMEIRMMGFYKYWLEDWKGINNRQPTITVGTETAHILCL